MAHWPDCCILGGRIAHRLDAASLLHCNPKCILILDPIGSPAFPSLRRGEAVFLAGRLQASKIPSGVASGIQKGCHVARCQHLQSAPNVMGKRGGELSVSQ